MRIHTNHPADVHTSIHRAANGMEGVYPSISWHGSRSHAGALELSLEGNGYARNSGTHGADNDTTGATWDEWGVIFAAIFAADFDAIAGSIKHAVYNGADDFTRKTGDRFSPNGLPEDTHKRHTWEYVSPRVFACIKCSAVRNNG